ncbi:hypothetical protein [Nitrosomonas ureae]|uniref:hypothetical protein n=1 Tax=Nitrosomonas ureae TaxID=44577 RepID=UPI000BB7409E|nr:hypothetical protein [Nitrosomonas ureae]
MIDRKIVFSARISQRSFEFMDKCLKQFTQNSLCRNYPAQPEPDSPAACMKSSFAAATLADKRLKNFSVTMG